MRALLSKALLLTVVLYVISLPVSFLVGGVLFARPIRSSVGYDDVRVACDEAWNPAFLGESREVKIQIDHNVRLAATVFGGGSRRCVILLHELAGNRTSVLPAAYALWAKGIDVVALDRRAHGNSDGESQPLFGGEPEVIQTVINQLVRNDWCGTGSIGVFGIGDAGVSCLLAAGQDERIDAVAAENPAPTATDLIAERMEQWSGLPKVALFAQVFLAELGTRLLGDVSSDQMDARTALADVEAPVLILTSGGSEQRQLARRAESSLVNASISNADDDIDYSQLAAFFHQHL